MLFQCPVTGITWGASPRSKIHKTLSTEHPMLTQDLGSIKEIAKNWETLTDSDKQLLWVATVRNNPLMVIRARMRPTISLVEGTFSSLLGLTVWVNLQRNPTEFLPRFVPFADNCSNMLNYLSQLTYEKHAWQERRDDYSKHLAEVEETGRKNRLLARYKLSQGIEADTLPANLVNWMLIASEVPQDLIALWKSFLCGTKEQILLNKNTSVASLDECLEHFECWEHPALVKGFAIKQLRAKIAYYNSNALDGKASLDFLLTSPASGKQTIKNKLFELDLSEIRAAMPVSRDELAILAKQKLARIKASQVTANSEGKNSEPTK